MDLRFLNAEPTDAERAAVDVLGAGGRDQLLPALHAVNDRIGWISQGALNHICRRLNVPPAEAYGVASFYALFSLKERPPRVLHVCTDLACRVNGAEALSEAAAAAGHDWHRSPCLGVCERAPAALDFEAGDPAEYRVLAPATPGDFASGTSKGNETPVSVPQQGEPGLRLLRRVGVVDRRAWTPTGRPVGTRR